MGRIGKLISGIILLLIGVFVAYYGYSNNLIDLILILGMLIAIVGIVFILTYFIDSSADQTRAFLKDHIKSIEKKSNISLSEISGAQPTADTSNGPLKIRKEFDNYDEEFYGDDDDYVYVEHDDDEYAERDSSKVLKPRDLDEETSDFGETLEFRPNYEKPIKITRRPKKREKGFFGDEQYVYLGREDKSESIAKALKEDDNPTANLKAPNQKQPRNIRIDVNNPEALPIPKLLNSFILFDNEIITTEEAFNKLAEKINKEVMLEIPSLNELSDRFLSYIPTIYSRVIIEEFDVSNMAYMILVASLLKQGVQIRTMPTVNTTNLITDDAYGLILSNGRGRDDMQYGAIYTDINPISEIRLTFEKAWEIATELDREIILKYMEKEAN